MKLRWFLIWLLSGLMLANFLFGCTAERRLSRLVKNHPELLQKDTIVISDTTIVYGSTVDSIFTFTRDTVVISDSVQTIKYFYNTETKHHYIKGEVKDRIVTKEIKVPYEKVVNKGASNTEILWYLGLGALMMLVLLIILAISRKRN